MTESGSGEIPDIYVPADLLPPTFRETEPVELWSASINTLLPYPSFESHAIEIAMESSQPLTGYVTQDTVGNVTSFTRTRYPRKKYGVTSLDECMNGFARLANSLGSNIEIDYKHAGFRIALGLVEGYDANAPAHTPTEVAEALSNDFNVSPASIFAIRFDGGGVSVYSEPAAIILGPLNRVSEVYYLADSYKQERFTVEDYKFRIAYSVETRFCTDPD